MKRLKAGKYPRKKDFEADIKLIDLLPKREPGRWPDPGHDIEEVYEVPDGSFVTKYRPGIRAKTAIYEYDKLGGYERKEFKTFDEVKRFAKKLKDEEATRRLRRMKTQIEVGKKVGKKIAKSIMREFPKNQWKRRITVDIKRFTSTGSLITSEAYALAAAKELKKYHEQIDKRLKKKR